LLREHAEGHHQLKSLLLEREVIYTEDVEKIFGKRQWSSRTEEIIRVNEELEKKREAEEAEKKKEQPESESGAVVPPPIPEDLQK